MSVSMNTRYYLEYKPILLINRTFLLVGQRENHVVDQEHFIITILLLEKVFGKNQHNQLQKQ